MLTAKEVMNGDVIAVKKNTSILRAMELMLEKKISGMPVVEDDMTLVGVITEMDVVNLAYNIIYDAGNLENKRVRHFMTDRVISFDKDDNLFDVCDFLAKNLFRRVPITSDGKVVGIISVPDIIKYILQISRGICGKTTG